MATTKPSRARTFLVVSVIALGAAAILIAVRLYLASPASWPSQEFSPGAWASGPTQERFRYFNDLARRHLLDQQPRQIVIQLLGTPDYEAPGGQYMQYVLIEAKPGNWMMNALYMVQIEFDASGRVSRYIVRHE